jgi:hypothetical protein
MNVPAVGMSELPSSIKLLAQQHAESQRFVSVFAGGWTLEAAERICAPDDGADSDELDLRTRLVDKSMVVAECGANGVERYRLLETLRQYGQERLAESGEAEAIRDAHFAYYFEEAKRAHIEVAAPRRRDEWLKRPKQSPGDRRALERLEQVQQALEQIVRLLSETPFGPADISVIRSALDSREAAMHMMVGGRADRDAAGEDAAAGPRVGSVWLEVKYIPDPVSERRYGPYLYGRWREGGRKRSRYIGKARPA